ncbi:MAG TPA: hypothetical protein VFV11_06820 [Solimonas sp.]|nr:hypothetical protein [Solimonas sp.]
MKKITAALLALLAAPMAQAADPDFDFDCTGSLNCQESFRGILEDTAAALNYKALGPAEATGLTGIGIGAFVNYTQVENEKAWKDLTGEDIDAVGMAGIVAHKGLPFGIDLGAFYTTVPGASVDVYGAEVRYAILEGGVASPALALRGSYTATDGIDDFDFETYGLDVSVSKGFTFLTPYAGVGYVWAKGTPQGSLAVQLDEETVERERIFVGLRIGIALLDITPEFERQGDNNGYNLRLGLSF